MYKLKTTEKQRQDFLFELGNAEKYPGHESALLGDILMDFDHISAQLYETEGLLDKWSSSLVRRNLEQAEALTKEYHKHFPIQGLPPSEEVKLGYSRVITKLCHRLTTVVQHWNAPNQDAFVEWEVFCKREDCALWDQGFNCCGDLALVEIGRK